MSLGPALTAFRIAGSGRGESPPGAVQEGSTPSSAASYTPRLLPAVFPLLLVPLSGSSQGTPSLFCCWSQFLLHESPSPSLEGPHTSVPPGAGRVTRCCRWFPAPHLPPGYHAHFTDEKTEAQKGRYRGSDSREPGLAL